jgi:hypothetical protein
MPAKLDITDEQVWRTYLELGVAYGARHLGIKENTMKSRVHRLKRTGPPDIDINEAPEEKIGIEELVERRKRDFEKKDAHHRAKKLIRAKVKIDGPIAVHFFGDPHVDDDGTDIATLERDCHLVRDTEGFYAANVGDTTNGWVGRLARLYGEQETSAETAWRLAEWFIRMCPRNEAEWSDRPPWLFIVAGNHDLWAGAGDPLKWITRQVGSIYESSQIRIGLDFPNGRQVRVNCRHDFQGHSQWNTAHGSMKAAQMGFRDHILLNGHKHTSGYGIVKDPSTGLVSHCVQVASYKVHDRYAVEKGLPDQSVSPSMTAVIDPSRDDEDPHLVTPFWCPLAAKAYLESIR